MSGARILQIFPSVTANALTAAPSVTTSGVTAGSTIALGILVPSDNSVGSINGATNGAYTPVDALVSSILNYQLCTYFFEDVAAGGEIITAALGFADTQYGLIAAEIGGVQTAGYDGHIGQAQGAVTAGSGTCLTGSGGSSTNANEPALIVAFGFMQILALNPGPGFAGNSYAGSPSVGGCFCVEGLRVTALAAQQASFSPGSNGTAALSALMIFDELIAAAAAGNQNQLLLGAG